MNKPIQIFVRHCNSSSNSVGKQRPSWFSREKCFQNLLDTSNLETTKINVVFDGKADENHFIKRLYHEDGRFGYIELMNGGNDGASFLNMLNYVKDKKTLDHFNDETIIYFLEDDYLHASGWETVLLEVFEYLNVDYVTLYDHFDKYFLPMYETLQSSIYVTPSCHWRTTPSTTNTYACKAKTLIKDFEIHRKFCDLEKGYTRDHDKFTHLWQNGSNLISSIPGYVTHVETQYLSPVVDWSKI